MDAVVIYLNRRNGRFAVRTVDGAIHVFDPLDTDSIEVGDQVRGDFKAHDEMALWTRGSARPMRVYLQALDCPAGHARKLLFQ